ncbi:MAG: hypothetical protein J5502_08005 [Prevotella sp.]|nr:hypothetical protein [Prevotella sp.]
MKKLYRVLAFVVVSFMMVSAGDTIKILRIYHNGTFTAIPLANIDSIDHSRVDVNSKLQKSNISSIIEAIDSTHNIALSEIDSVVVTEANLDDYQARIMSIQEYISAQEEKEVEKFQKDLISWLSKQDWVTFTSINKNHNLITIIFADGINFYIDFQDACLFDEQSKSRSYVYSRSPNEEDNYLDVSCQNNEKLLDNSNMLLIQGRTMFDEPSYQAEEYNLLSNTISQSPVNILMTLTRNSLSFLRGGWSNYSMIIISQTHGADDLPGAFQVMDLSPSEVGIGSISIYVKDKYIFRSKSTSLIWWVKPHVFPKLSPNNNSILYLNYCDSYGASNYINCTILGFPGWSFYYTNERALNIFVGDMLDGNTYENSFEHDRSLTHVLRDPVTNYANSKQRYFSISTKDISDNGEIEGTINGYKNLKSGLKWVLYAHEGKEKFTPKDINVKRIEDAYEPKSDGSFTISRDVVNKYPDHAFIVGFEYAGKVYYGEMKTAGIHLCPDDNHPHMIDLGLPSGTKWACCNVGASDPKDVGHYYAWGMLIESEGYNEDNYKYCKEVEPYGYEYDYLGSDISGTKYDVARYEWGSSWRIPTLEDCNELYQATCMNSFHQEMINLNGVWGTVIRSNNGNAVFFPYAGIKMAVGKKVDFLNSYGSAGSYWTSTTDNPENVYGSVSYSFSVGGGASVEMDQPNVHAKYHGLSVRPVAQ